MNTTTRNILIVLAIAIIGFIIIRAVDSPSTTTLTPTEIEPVVDQTPQVAPEGDPTFTWSYVPSEKNEIPQSTISLTATYPNGAKHTKEVETIEGGCNEHPDPDKDVYKQSQMIICYYAGFGRYYKVIKAPTGYAVQRKEFEEASPDYNPPKQEFKTVATF